MDNEKEAPVTDDGWVVIEGGHYMLIPYGAEHEEDGTPWFESPCHICGTAAHTFHETGCPMGPGLLERPETCRDCGIAVGKYHVMGCGIERCPRCSGQYMSCSCDGSEDARDSADSPESDGADMSGGA